MVVADPGFETTVFPLAIKKTSMSKPLNTGAQTDGEHQPVDKQHILENTEASILDLPLPSGKPTREPGNRRGSTPRPLPPKKAAPKALFLKKSN